MGVVEGTEPSGDRPLSCDNVTSHPPLWLPPLAKAGPRGSRLCLDAAVRQCKVERGPPAGKARKGQSRAATVR